MSPQINNSVGGTVLPLYLSINKTTSIQISIVGSFGPLSACYYGIKDYCTVEFLGRSVLSLLNLDRFITYSKICIKIKETLFTTLSPNDWGFPPRTT